MDVNEIIQQLQINNGSFPEAALLAAVEQQELITPFLLSEIAESPEAIEQKDEMYIYNIYAIYLLAQFQEQAVYPLLGRFFSYPGELSLDMTGDVVTEDLGRILASVCYGDLSVIKHLIEDLSVNVYVRSAGLDALVILVLHEKLDRNEVVEYFRKCFRAEENNENNSYFLTSLVLKASCFHPRELLPEIRSAYLNQRVDALFIDLDSIEEKAKLDINTVLANEKKYNKGFVVDVISELSWWACFDDNSSKRNNKKTLLSQYFQNLPNIKITKIGRNAPCSCGSGKKYKKCCLQ